MRDKSRRNQLRDHRPEDHNVVPHASFPVQEVIQTPSLQGTRRAARELPRTGTHSGTPAAAATMARPHWSHFRNRRHTGHDHTARNLADTGNFDRHTRATVDTITAAISPVALSLLPSLLLSLLFLALGSTGPRAVSVRAEEDKKKRRARKGWRSRKWRRRRRKRRRLAGWLAGWEAGRLGC